MTVTRNLLAAFALGVALAIPHLAFAQYGGQGLGSALSSNPMSHQGNVKPGVDDMQGNASEETPFKIIKDVKLGLKDADPATRIYRTRTTPLSAGSRSQSDPDRLDVRPRRARQG